MSFVVPGIALMIAFGLIVLLVLAFIHYEYYSLYCDSYDASIANIDFKSFYDWYSLNPDRYELRENNVRVKMDKSKSELMGFAKYRDWLKYRKFVTNLNNRKNQIASDKSLVKILNTVQSDIDATRLRISKERNQVIENISHII